MITVRIGIKYFFIVPPFPDYYKGNGKRIKGSYFSYKLVFLKGQSHCFGIFLGITTFYANQYDGGFRFE